MRGKTEISWRRLSGLVILGIGIVYGDIGTSPLYALKECFYVHGGLSPQMPEILGILSLVVWSLILIVSGKYVSLVMRADYKGEGGIVALIALLSSCAQRPLGSRAMAILGSLGIFGTALLYGDGMITPAISVLSAVEGLQYAAPSLQSFVVPVTIVILIVLFSFQRVGTTRVGGAFGPIMVVWFITLAALGVNQILKNPQTLHALNPYYGILFLMHHGLQGFYVLGSVFLAVTGAEALYADLGHFGRKPIQIGWVVIVFPSLVLNYLGQGALLLREPALVENPFYGLAPAWALYPLVGLATLATVIASQALISGAFSLTLQAIQLGYLPRLKVKHTSENEYGQIYIAHINWILMLACIGLVVGFKSSSALASAYGVAVTLTMLITTILMVAVMRKVWEWSWIWIVLLSSIFLLAESGFFIANSLKIAHGGWFALVSAALIFVVMKTWKRGRAMLFEYLQTVQLPLDLFIADVERNQPTRVKGCAVFFSSSAAVTPLALLHNLRYNKVLHEHIVLLTVHMEDRPFVPESEAMSFKVLRAGFYQILAHYGYMQEMDVTKLIQDLSIPGASIKLSDTTFFLSRETLIRKPVSLLPRWQRSLFIFLARNATSAARFFHLPPSRVIELGMQIEM